MTISLLQTSLDIIGATKKVWKKRKKNPSTLSLSMRKNMIKQSNKTVKHQMSPKEKQAAGQQKVAVAGLTLLSIGAVTTPTIGLLGLPFIAYNYLHMMRGVWQSYRNKSKLSVVIFDAFCISFTLFMGFFVATALLFSVLFTAKRLIARTEREAQADFSRIFGELADTAWLLKAGVEIEVPLNELHVSDIIVVRAGSMIPVDGTIVSGEGMVDQRLLTGESQPSEKSKGDTVFTSTLLISGHLNVQVEKHGSETITGQIAQTLEHAATFKHQVQSRGERIIEKGASRTMLASLSAVPFVGVSHALALTYSGFGYQMRVSAPLMVLNYLRIASRYGILIKDGRALDELQRVDTIVFDKTGTLTEETPHVGRMSTCNDFSEQQLLQYAASAEQHQTHPIALAICQQANEQGITLLSTDNIDYAIGHGLRVDLDLDLKDDSNQNQSTQTETVLIGSQRFMQAEGIVIPEAIDLWQQNATEKGYSVVYVATHHGDLVGALELRPTLRPDAKAAINALHDMGMTLYIISGDQEKPTRHLAKQLGIDHYFAETLPEDKAKHIANLQQAGHKVCFIGDGINDSVALQKADVSVSLHGAATIAQDTADIVLITPDLLHLRFLIHISRNLNRYMNYSEVMNNTSGIMCVSGVLVLGMSVSGAMLLYVSGLLASVSGAMLPLLERPEEQNSQPLNKLINRD